MGSDFHSPCIANPTRRKQSSERGQSGCDQVELGSLHFLCRSEIYCTLAPSDAPAPCCGCNIPDSQINKSAAADIESSGRQTCDAPKAIEGVRSRVSVEFNEDRSQTSATSSPRRVFSLGTNDATIVWLPTSGSWLTATACPFLSTAHKRSGRGTRCCL